MRLNFILCRWHRLISFYMTRDFPLPHYQSLSIACRPGGGGGGQLFCCHEYTLQIITQVFCAKKNQTERQIHVLILRFDLNSMLSTRLSCCVYDSPKGPLLAETVPVAC